MKTALLFGALIALANAVSTFLFFFLGYHSDPTKLAALGQIPTLIYIVLLVGGIILAVRARRAEIPAGIHFGYGSALGVAFLTGLFSALFGSAFYFVYISFINPSFNDVLLQVQVAKLQEKGMNAQQIEGAKKFMAMMFKPVVQCAMSFLFSTILGFVTSLIVAAFLKRDSQAGTNLPPPIAAV